MTVVRNVMINVWEWLMRFRNRAPRTRFEAAVHAAIYAFIDRYTARGEIVIHGFA